MENKNTKLSEQSQNIIFIDKLMKTETESSIY